MRLGSLVCSILAAISLCGASAFAYESGNSISWGTDGQPILAWEDGSLLKADVAILDEHGKEQSGFLVGTLYKHGNEMNPDYHKCEGTVCISLPYILVRGRIYGATAYFLSDDSADLHNKICKILGLNDGSSGGYFEWKKEKVTLSGDAITAMRGPTTEPMVAVLNCR